MRIHHLAGIVLIALGGACGDTAQREDHPSQTAGATRPRSMVGRWALDSFVANGKDYTSEVRSSPTDFYTFNGDGTFGIARRDSLLVTGSWSEDTTASPMTFDHRMSDAGKPGSRLLGIFAVTGDTLVITITGAHADGRRPATFHSALADSSELLVLHRAPR
jgi:uncharacterized protein (TIGR03067 family)